MYFDSSGNPVGDIEQASFDGIITNTSTGEQFRDREDDPSFSTSSRTPSPSTDRASSSTH